MVYVKLVTESIGSLGPACKNGVMWSKRQVRLLFLCLFQNQEAKPDCGTKLVNKKVLCLGNHDYHPKTV